MFHLPNLALIPFIKYSLYLWHHGVSSWNFHKSNCELKIVLCIYELTECYENDAQVSGLFDVIWRRVIYTIARSDDFSSFR